MPTQIIIQDDTAGCWIPINNTFGNKQLADDANDPKSGYRSGVLLQLGAFSTAPGNTLDKVLLRLADGSTQTIEALEVVWLNIYHPDSENALSFGQLIQLLTQPVHQDLRITGVVTYWTDPDPASEPRYQMRAFQNRDADHPALNTFVFDTGSKVKVDLLTSDFKFHRFDLDQVERITISTKDDTNHGSHIDPPR